MLRVLIATNSRDRGSTSRTLEAWTRLLPGHGIEPLVSVGGPGPLHDALTAAGVPVFDHPIRAFYQSGERVRFLREIARLALRLRRSRIDLVHVNEHEHYPVVGRAAYLAGVPAVTHVRFTLNGAMARWLFKAPYTPRRVFFTSETQIADTAAAVAEAVPSDRFRLVRNGLDFSHFGRDRTARERLRSEWRLPAGAVAIGTASSISPRKRLDHFIRVISALAVDGLPVHGFIAGQPYFPEDEEELRALHRLRDDLGLADRVTFLGYVEPAEPLYHAWDIVISASKYETFGMTVLEAMACGRPVVVYPGGSVAEVVGDAGAVVPEGDEIALAEATRRLCVDDEHRAERGAAARERASQFAIQRSAALLADEYRAVLNGGSP